MKRINTISKLESLRESIFNKGRTLRTVIRVCDTGCRARKSAKVIEALETEIVKQGLQDNVDVRKTGCHGFCEMGPIMVVGPEGIFYCRVSPEDVADIVSETVSDLLCTAHTFHTIQRAESAENTGQRRPCMMSHP